ncbi:MAG: glycoside hydrolase family 15 protein [Steroidobacteraceae bacterium]
MHGAQEAATAAARALPSQAPIADFALIGDCRSAALISRDGGLVWLCLPRFESPAVFGALLDERGGDFTIAPAPPASASRRYRAGSNVLETTFETADGVVRLTDCMPIPCERNELRPMREVLRCVEGIAGEVRLRIRVEPRPDYGRADARLERRGRRLWLWTWRSNALHLHADADLEPDGLALRAEVPMRAGEHLWFSLCYEQDSVAVIPPLGASAARRLADTDRWWRKWAGRARYAGPYRDAVERSALALKLLCSAQSAAVVAAPTTSLPEWPGATRNWDYRYCWLRDAALTMRAFTGLGYLEEGRAFLGWLLHATRLTWPKLRVLYDIYGRSDLDELALRHWKGYRDSRPVRVGNGAATQTQLDIYGAVCFAAREYVEAAGELKPDEARLLNGLGREVCRSWQDPDHGIWEMRGALRHYTFSKVMCWTALDSLLRLEAAGHLKAGPVVASVAPEIRAAVEARGYNAGLQSYVLTFDGRDPDASLLLPGCLGYEDPRHDRMRGTFDYVHARLGRNGLLYRYEPGSDGFASPEGAFAICSYFAIVHLACRGEPERAHASFRHVQSFANDVGLLSEEIDPESGELLGNFPQAYTHVGLINAALALARAEAAA